MSTILAYNYPVPSLHQTQPAMFAQSKFNAVLRKGDPMEEKDIVDPEVLVTNMKMGYDTRSTSDSLANWFVSSEMIKIAELRVEAIKRAQLLTVFPDPVAGQFDDRLTKIEGFLVEVNSRLTKVEGYLGGVDGRFDRLESRLDGLERQMQVMSFQMAELHGCMQQLVRGQIGGSEDISLGVSL